MGGWALSVLLPCLGLGPSNTTRAANPIDDCKIGKKNS